MPDQLKSAGFAGLFEPSRSGADMADFVAIDAPQDRRRATVSRRYESLDRRRGHVQPPGLQHHRHDGEAGERVMRRRLGRLPEAVMGGKRAIGGAEALQPPIEQREMHRLVGAYAEPVADELRTEA